MNVSYDEDNDNDNNSSFYLMIIYCLPGTAQQSYEVAPDIPIL